MKKKSIKKVICFDIDGVICETKSGNYKKSKPIKKAIEVINKLYKKNKIILFTARYMGRSKGISSIAEKRAKKLTINQLSKWNVNYHHIIFAKPSYDLIIDDKALGFKKTWYKNFKFQVPRNNFLWMNMQ